MKKAGVNGMQGPAGGIGFNSAGNISEAVPDRRRKYL
jgi:hypothetical protein